MENVKEQKKLNFNLVHATDDWPPHGPWAGGKKCT